MAVDTATARQPIIRLDGIGHGWQETALAAYRLVAGVQAAPLVAGLLRRRAAAARGTEAVAAVPSQHRAGLSHDSCRAGRPRAPMLNTQPAPLRRPFIAVLTGLFLAEPQQVSVGRLREAAALSPAARQEFGGILVRVDGEPGGRLPDAIRHVSRGRGGRLPPLHSEEDEHSRGLLEEVFDGLVSEPTQLGLRLRGVRRTTGGADHGAEVGEQEVDGVRVAPSDLQPDPVGPLGAQPVQRLSAEVVLRWRVEEGGARRAEEGGARRAFARPAQQVCEMPVAPERGDVVGGLRRVVHGELIAAGKRTEEILGEDATDPFNS
ncbi:hypothetical protein EYF80_051670 [Liparis tanakae]|uniref:Uncharacterized protein n=1 Tax=Liparis tanakae TaxID=230148 RepID=A0A4Z2FAK8_9TELE|nr:hypothetical protein EYF80_051670 [Liparis tanakae]